MKYFLRGAYKGRSDLYGVILSPLFDKASKAYAWKDAHGEHSLSVSNGLVQAEEDTNLLPDIVGCGYCKIEKICKKHDPKRNQAREGCEQYEYYKL